MSGTSLDGLDLALCRFLFVNGKWEYDILKCTTLPYDQTWKGKLKNAISLNGLQLAQLDIEFGGFIGRQAQHFIRESGLMVKLISSHGHTVFHQPDKRLTVQIGNGAEIAARAGVPTVCDFRKKDVALGGQGAPLVPVGDELLFSQYNYCLNLGGFANVSFSHEGKRRAFDICPVNIVLNELAELDGLEYDQDGKLGRQGSINNDLLEKLNNLEYYTKSSPKSLGKEWLDTSFLPLLADSKINQNNVLRTIYEHFAQQIGHVLSPHRNVLVTGGGVYNKFLMERIRHCTTAKLIAPDDNLIQYKEALIFALLGLLRWRGEINCYGSVTGATVDSCTGSVYL